MSEALQWTDKSPAQPGWYLRMVLGSYCVSLMLHELGMLRSRDDEIDRHRGKAIPSPDTCLWYGPIPIPGCYPYTVGVTTDSQVASEGPIPQS